MQISLFPCTSSTVILTGWYLPDWNILPFTGLKETFDMPTLSENIPFPQVILTGKSLLITTFDGHLMRGICLSEK